MWEDKASPNVHLNYNKLGKSCVLQRTYTEVLVFYGWRDKGIFQVKTASFEQCCGGII